MPESVNSGGSPAPPKKDMSMELRLLIAFVLMGAVMFTMPYFYKTIAPQSAKKAAPPAAQQQQPQQPAQAAEVKPAPPPAPAPAAPAAPVAAQKEDFFFVDTDLYHVTFSNRGGVVTSWLLKKYRTHDGKPLELVNTAAKMRPLAFYFDQQKPSVDLNQALFAPKPDADGLGMTYEFSNGQVYAKKTIRFKKNSYLSQVNTQVTENGKYIPALLAWRGGFGDLAVVNPASLQQTLYYDAAANKLEKKAAKAAKDGPVAFTGQYSFAGIEDTYFAAAFLPEGVTTVKQVTFSDSTRTVLEQKEEPFAGVAVGNGGANRFSLFVGPKDLDILKAVNPKLEQIVDFGWFGLLAKPLFLIVNWANDNIVHNYGWAIVLVTIVLNFILFPLRLSNMKSMKKMQALQPQIAAINDKYKGISIRDPRKTQQNQEVMDLYKRHGVNPMGGCVPILIQIPFFIAFYKVFSVSVEMRMASWLWVTDLSQPEQLAIKILPIAMIVSQFYMQKMTPATGMDPNQQKMMLIMPLVFGFMFYNFSSGLVLYYLTSNLVMIAQQWFFNRTSVAEAVARSVQAAPKKRNGKK